MSLDFQGDQYDHFCSFCDREILRLTSISGALVPASCTKAFLLEDVLLKSAVLVAQWLLSTGLRHGKENFQHDQSANHLNYSRNILDYVTNLKFIRMFLPPYTN